ncbi:MAG: LytR/AlgR family response regulator transcription factor [Blastocatellia bacterium]
MDGRFAHHFRGTVYHLLVYGLIYFAVIKLVKRKTDQYAKYMWLFLFSFCFLFLLLMKLIVAGSFERFVFQLDAPIYLFVFISIYLGIVNLVRKKMDQGANRSTVFSKYVRLFVVSALFSVTLSLALTIGIESLIFGKSHRPYDYVVNWLFYLIFFAIIGNSYISYLYLADLNQARENLQAFDKNGIGYLLKPIEYEKFVAAMRKFDGLRRSFTFGHDLLSELKATLAQPRYKERFVIKARGGIYLLETRLVAYIQMQDEIPFAYDGQGARYPLHDSLNQLEKDLDPLLFFRLNRSEIVNLHFIEKLEPYSHDRLAIKLKRLNLTLISSINRTPELRRWIEDGRVA